MPLDRLTFGLKSVEMEDSAWDKFKSVVELEGYELFDLDIPRGETGTYRVYIDRRSKSDEAEVSRSVISIDDCTVVTKAVLADLSCQELLGESYALEVSSPGINRRLRLPDHFEGAIGERVKVKFRTSTGTYTNVIGVLESFDGENLSVLDNEKVVGGEESELIKIPLSSVLKARIDFDFSNI